jgi:hypothetical protein
VAGDRAADVRRLLDPLISADLVRVVPDETTLHVLVPDLEATLLPSLEAWLRAAGESLA